tara:strand:- start:5451 stop:6266 length:816 start_codon:yes stop_codon:yes gene_type:complete
MGVYVLVVGGLGNQLFTIFAGIAYFLEHRVPFKLVSAERRRPFYYNTFLSNLKGFVMNDTGQLRNMTRYVEPNFHYNKIPYCEKFILQGYWQSHKYFKEHINNILRLTNICETKDKVKIKYKYRANTISMHFRIGDYTMYKEHHNILELNYYMDALSKLLDKDDSIKNVLIFGEKCDNAVILNRLNILKEKFNEIDFQVIDHNIVDYEQMMIMSNCKYNIIANSSFSLMASYLNRNEDKKVFYPSKWFGPANQNKDTKDIPEDKGWFRIDV